MKTLTQIQHIMIKWSCLLLVLVNTSCLKPESSSLSLNEESTPIDASEPSENTEVENTEIEVSIIESPTIENQDNSTFESTNEEVYEEEMVTVTGKIVTSDLDFILETEEYAKVNITEAAVNDAPVANNAYVGMDAGMETTIILNAKDADGDTLIYKASNADHGTLGTVAGNTVTFTPTSGYSGPASFTFTASDGKATSNVATIKITVIDSAKLWGFSPDSVPMETTIDGLCTQSQDEDFTNVFTSDPHNKKVCRGYPIVSGETFCQGPSCQNNSCFGTKPKHFRSFCTGAKCCLENDLSGENPILTDRYINPNDNNDSVGIYKAMECASEILDPAKRIVQFSAGKIYTLRTPIFVIHDNITLTGPTLVSDTDTPSSQSATLLVEPCNPEQQAFAILVDGNEPRTQIKIQNFRITLSDGPRISPYAQNGKGRPYYEHAGHATSVSGIQLNRCSDCRVENIIMHFAGKMPIGAGSGFDPNLPPCKPYNLDGITFAQGSGGVIRNVIVDGVPKVGIYVASIEALDGSPPILIENCQVKNSNGPLGGSGMSIVGQNVTVKNCLMTGNIKHPGALPPEYDVGQVPPFEEGNGIGIGGGILDTYPIIPQNILIQDSFIHHNGGNGIHLGSFYHGARPTDVTLKNVRISHNGVWGVFVEAGDAVTLENSFVWGNGYGGVMVSSKVTMPELSFGTERISDVLIQNSFIFDNVTKPLFIKNSNSDTGGVVVAADEVSLDSNSIFTCDIARCMQRFGVRVSDYKLNGIPYSPTSFFLEDTATEDPALSTLLKDVRTTISDQF